MKKLKKVLIILAIVVLGLVAVIRFFGPSDVVVLTEEEEKQQQQEQIKKFQNVNLKGFKAKDLNNKEIDSDIFSKNKLTMVNIWATWCGPCIDEMPEISKLNRDLPKGTSIISICIDAGDGKEYLDIAKDVMKKSNANFTTLIPDEFLKKNLTDGIQILPTTIFVDSGGKVVGTPHFGGNTANDYRKSINDRLKLMEEK